MATEQRRKTGAVVVVAALVVVGATACSGTSGDTTTDTAPQPSQTQAMTGTVTPPPFTSRFLGYLDLTTGETSMTDLIPSNSAISPPGGVSGRS